MAVSEARKRANQKWSDKTYKIKTFRLHLKHDADILEYLDTKESVNRYLKDLIREDIERQKKEGKADGIEKLKKKIEFMLQTMDQQGLEQAYK